MVSTLPFSSIKLLLRKGQKSSHQVCMAGIACNRVVTFELLEKNGID